jgi:methyl-accepting chemotaxis protein
MKFGPRTVKRAKAQAAFLENIAAKARETADPILARQAAELARRARKVAQHGR